MSLFSLLIGLGASLALLRLAFTVAEEERIRWLLYGLAVLVMALIGARLAFVLEHVNYYTTRKGELADLSAGGLWWPGAAAGGLLAIIFIGFVKNNGIKETLDKFSVYLLPLAAAFWLAGWSGGVAYGARVDPGVWWGISMLDVTGVTAPRFPLQLLAAVTIAGTLGAIEWRWKKPAARGRRMGVLLLVLSAHTLLFSLLRADPAQPFIGLRIDVWASIVFSILSASLLAGTFDVKSREINAEKEPTE